MPLSLFAEAQIVFLELKKPNGEVLQLEPGFRYAHVAILQEGRWWHAYPGVGVRGVSESELRRVGVWGPRFSVPEESIQLEISRYDGLPYDNQYTWKNDRFYCSELVAKALGLAPEPMHFDLQYWPAYFEKFEGLPGMSPGKIFDYLTAAPSLDRLSAR
jgi:hypothetical protein